VTWPPGRGLRVAFEVGDAERLDYPDASFDVVSSAHGVVHAYDHRAVATELARVCRLRGRLGLSYWLPNPELQALMERVGYARRRAPISRAIWVRRDYATALLGDAFDLEFAKAVCPWTGESGAAMWRLLIESDGPARAGSQASAQPIGRRWSATGLTISMLTARPKASMRRGRTCSSWVAG
jgi:ubiquinone/menaquinone biosynthesis C-methylase UbiE